MLCITTRQEEYVLVNREKWMAQLEMLLETRRASADSESGSPVISTICSFVLLPMMKGEQKGVRTRSVRESMLSSVIPLLPTYTSVRDGMS